MPHALRTQHWRQRLASSRKPAYQLIPELIAEDVRSGRLTARDRLPTLRELAAALELNYTTAARAYAEARERGLIVSRPGLGTYVRGGLAGVPLRAGTGAEMTMNMPPELADPALQARLRASAAQVLEQADLHDLLRYHDFGGSPRDRAAGAAWLAPRLPRCDADQLLLCPGIHSVLLALVSLLARPGQTVAAEALAYPGMKAIATQLGVQLHPLAMDDEGILPLAFEEACRTVAPKALYLCPTLHNPTTATLSLSRREALADVALRYSVPIIEDDAYGMLPPPGLPALSTLAPELGYYISGMSKCLGAGLRAAYVRSPNVRASQRLAGALRATAVMGSPVTEALVTRWIEDGSAEAVLQAMRTENRARMALAAQHLGRFGLQAQPEGFHFWLPLSSAWSPVELASYLRTRGVGVVASAAFATDGDPPDAVRVCLGGSLGSDDCAQALQLIADTLDHPRHPHATIM